MNNKTIFILTVILAAGIFLSGCDPFEGEYRDGTRNIVIDLDNGIFKEPSAVNVWEQGPGIESLTVTYVLGGNETVKTISVDEMTAGDFPQLSHEVTGRLERIDVSAVNAAGTAMTVSIEDKSNDDEFFGWETFANLQRFRIGYNGNSADGWISGYLTIDIAPLGGTSIRFKKDSGVTAQMETDWNVSPLISGQLAIEPVLNENPVGLSFDVYTLVVDENLKDLYKPGYITTSANYEYNPWKDVWTYAELTGSGLKIGDTEYKMAKYNIGDSLPFTAPTENGIRSFLIDFSSSPEVVGKYLMIAVVTKYDVLSVPSRVDIIEIR